MNLAEYLDPFWLDLAHAVSRKQLIEVGVPPDEDYPGIRLDHHPLLGQHMGPVGSDIDLLNLHALAELVREGAKVVRPTAELCRVLRHVDLDLGVRDYAQPFPSMGVVIPGPLLGVERDVLAVSLWLPNRGLHVVGFVDRGASLVWCSGGVHHPATLDAISRMNVTGEGAGVVWSPEVEGQCGILARLAWNLGLLAVEQGVTVRPLDPRAERRQGRSSRDERMARLSARDAREVVVRDIDLITRPALAAPRGSSGGHWRQPAHIRRGHWRMQPVGPRREAKRRI